MSKQWWFGKNSWWCKVVSFLSLKALCYSPSKEITPPVPPPAPEPPAPTPTPTPTPTPAPIKMLPVEKTFNSQRRIIAPFLIPTMLTNKRLSLMGIENFAKKFAEEEYGNVLRFFSYGIWEKCWKQKLMFPWLKTGDWSFSIALYDEDYWDQLIKRLEIFVRRRITIAITMIDDCSLHEKAGTHWALHPMNGKNNSNGTSEWMPSVYHYYEDEWHDINHIREFRKQRSIAGLPADPTDNQIKNWIKALDRTGENLEVFYDHLVKVVEGEFRPYIIWEASNEGQARNLWHDIMLKILKKYNVPKHRRMTSIRPNPKFDSFYTQDIARNFLYSVHMIKDKESYLERKKLVPSGARFMASQDGFPPTQTTQETEDLVYYILKDGCIGFEQNLRPIFELEGNTWKNVGCHEDWTLTSLRFEYARAVKEGWEKWMR